MIDLFRIQISQLIQNRAEINEQTLPEARVTKAIRVQKYASSVFPVNSLENNIIYASYNYQANKNYLTNVMNYLFNDIYTAQEKSILVLFAITRISNHFIVSDEVAQAMHEIIDLTSDKVDIQYYIDEIKFKYLLHLTLVPTDTRDEQLIERLMTELAEIEDAHNKINLDERITE